MSTADEKPMSGTTFVVMTVLMVLGALFLLRWFLSTVAFLFNTLILVALVAGAVFLFVKARGRDLRRRTPPGPTIRAAWTSGSCSATELIDGYERGDFTCAEVMADVVERIRAVNPQVNAIVVDLGDAARPPPRPPTSPGGRPAPLGPLHGVPVTIKQNLDVEGQPTPNGLPALAGTIAPADSAVVANLRRAGAIFVGRTNVPELSMRFTTSNPIDGPTRNPWHPDASPGGSSGGAGAATAAGFGPIHHGNDIAGSLRVPAWCNGVTTIKPSQGRLPAYNPTATAERGLLSSLMSAQGVLARTVADVRLATRAMAARDPRDPLWLPVPFDGPTLRATAAGGGDDEPPRLPDRPPDRRPGRAGRGAPGRRRLRRGGGRAAPDHRPRPRVDEHRHHRDQADARRIGPRPRQRRARRRLRRLLRHGRAASTWSTTAPGCPTGPA